ncbi:alkaline phosphatase family protein [Streptomyces sp. 549]|uniref:nucleotide pyrophosphatase/phosphodiesterase family protein n=1 Tax=Streptomyces sp. 549 TaxID=3049076 RepID=UPI0024C2CEAB|nr:alkaline phosphatase family protein [Streptomyces sp. 549]MDK1472080.1 alkaline phosphatase family protein [Streptomyces sp. 549]
MNDTGTPAAPAAAAPHDPDRPRPLLVVDVVGLTPRLLAAMPHLSALAANGTQQPLETVLPAVTCTVQSTLLTGALPAEHGVVGNGWYFRDLGEVLLWRQHNALVGGEKVWDAARSRRPGYTVANICWWYAMGADTDWTVTPRPVYYADGRKEPDCYTRPPELHDELVSELGEFPLFSYWGPRAGIASSRWITGATRHVLRTRRPDLTLAYLPHLDYDLQRHGPDDPRAFAAATALDTELAPLLDDARDAGVAVVVLSEYGITRADRPVDVNRALRRAGLLEVHTQDGMEYLDPAASRAFAVADHQIAHVYVRRPEDVEAARAVLADLPGVDLLLDEAGRKEHGLDHARAGELVAVAEPGAWFTYYYWLDDARAPDFAQLVEIHRKPGYDPAELFMDPRDPYVRVRAATALARKKAGLRYRMAVVPLDPSPVSGSHGRLPAHPDDGPVLLCSLPGAADGPVPATAVKNLLLDLSLGPPADASSSGAPSA